MHYRPSLPKYNDNVSHNHPLREFLVLIGGVTALVLVVYGVLGLFVDFAVAHISPRTEALIFAGSKMRWQDSTAQSSASQKALQRMTDDLRHCLDIPYPVSVHLMETKEVNAMALPGGDIVVFSGLLNKVRSENGLCFVLAHELAHYQNRDHLRAMGRGIVLLALSTALTGAGSDLSQLLAPTTALGQAQYSQSRESKADRTALTALNCRYGHVGGATELFKVLSKKKTNSGHGVSAYFASHPAPKQRIAALNQLAAEMGFTMGPVTAFAYRTAP